MVGHRPGEHRRRLVMSARADYRIWDVRKVPGSSSKEIQGRLAARPEPARLVVHRDCVVAEHTAQGVQEISGQTRRGQRGYLYRGGIGRPDSHVDQAADSVRQGLRQGRVAPPLGMHVHEHTVAYGLNL